MTEPKSQYATLENPLMRAYQHALDDLNNAFGIDFDLWEYGAQWVCTDHSCSAEDVFKDFLARVDLNELLTQVASLQTPKVRPLTSSSRLIAIPLTTSKPSTSIARAVVAVGIVTDGSVELLRRLSTTTLNLIREKQITRKNLQQINQYTEQTSCDFEELYWLRNLVQYLEVCYTNSPTVDVTESVLSTLKEKFKSRITAILSRPSR